MKLGADSSRKLAYLLEKRRREIGASFTDLAASSGVHTSQVSRICRGEFVTLTGNVLQICTALGVDPALGEFDLTDDIVEGTLRRRVLESALAMWDGTPEGADRLVRLFGDLADIAGTSLRKD